MYWVGYWVGRCFSTVSRWPRLEHGARNTPRCEVSKSDSQHHTTLANNKKVLKTPAVDGTNNRNRRSNQVVVCGPEESRVLHLSESPSTSRALQCVRALFGDRPVLLRMCCDYFLLNRGGPATHGNALKCNRGVGTGASPNTHTDVEPVGTMPSMLGVAIISSIDGLRGTH